MQLRFKSPDNIDKVSVEHQQFDVDETHHIIAPLRFKETLIRLGFVPSPEPEPPVPEEPQVDDDVLDAMEEVAEEVEVVEEPVAEEVVEEPVAEEVVEEEEAPRRKYRVEK